MVSRLTRTSGEGRLWGCGCDGDEAHTELGYDCGNGAQSHLSNRRAIAWDVFSPSRYPVALHSMKGIVMPNQKSERGLKD